MGAAVVVEADPVTDGACRVLDAVEALAMDALFFQCPDHTLDHAILLRAMRRDELLFEAIASDQRGVAAAGDDEAVVGPQKELTRDLSQGAEPGDEGMLQCAGSSRCLAGSRQMPAQKLTGVTVNDEGQSCPAVAPRPDTAKVGGLAFVWCVRDRGHRFDARSHANRALTQLPALDLEDALHGVLVEAQKPKATVR